MPAVHWLKAAGYLTRKCWCRPPPPSPSSLCGFSKNMFFGERFSLSILTTVIDFSSFVTVPFCKETNDVSI